MKVAVLALVFAVALAAAAPTKLSTQEYLFQFELYQRQFNKVYSAAEKTARFNAFVANYDFIQQHNAEAAQGLHSFTVGLNQFADLTQAEWAAQYLRPYNSTRQRNFVVLPESNELAGSLDWRSKGAVTPIKNQGQCGSCWSFSTTGSVEGVNQIVTGTLVSISEQQLVDCSGSFGNEGCNGGLMDDAFKYIISNGGLDTEADYAYTARDGTCDKAKEAKKVVSITGFADVPQNNENQLIAAVNKNPVSVAIEADQQAFQLYKSGVFDSACGTQLDHGVLAVGYGTESGKDYWIVKNSWGTTWGDQGYILMAQHKGASGICGINMMASYPTKTKETAKPKLVAASSAAPANGHYEQPPCGSDEEAIQITGIQGSYCAPSCSSTTACPTDVPAGTTATPECVVETAGSSSPTLCALICDPSSGGCPSGSTCKPIQGVGVCTYP